MYILLYSSETWAVLMEDVRQLELKEMKMRRRMCGISLNDWHTIGNLKLTNES